jgi:hypothetical protein
MLDCSVRRPCLIFSVNFRSAPVFAILLETSCFRSSLNRHGSFGCTWSGWRVETNRLQTESRQVEVGLDGLLVALTLGTVLGLVGLVAQGILGGGGTKKLLVVGS